MLNKQRKYALNVRLGAHVLLHIPNEILQKYIFDKESTLVVDLRETHEKSSHIHTSVEVIMSESELLVVGHGSTDTRNYYSGVLFNGTFDEYATIAKGVEQNSNKLYEVEQNIAAALIPTAFAVVGDFDAIVDFEREFPGETIIPPQLFEHEQVLRDTHGHTEEEEEEDAEYDEDGEQY